MEMPELMERAEFSTDTRRGLPENSLKLKQIIEQWAAGATTADIIEKLERYGVPTSPIHSIKDICESEHARVRGLLAEVNHPVAGTVRLPTMPVKFSATPAAIEQPSPLLGQHNHSVLSGTLCYTKNEIASLEAEQII